MTPQPAQQAELEYLKEKREQLYQESSDNSVEIEIITEKIQQILRERYERD